MKTHTQITVLTLVAITASLMPSCISTAIDRSTSKHRNLFSADKTRAEFRARVGEPIESWERGKGKTPKYQTSNAYAYDVFLVKGKIAKPGDGSAQAMFNAVTLGTGEAISLPFTILGAAAKPFVKQLLVVYYGRRLYYRSHSIYDSNGHKEDILGY